MKQRGKAQTVDRTLSSINAFLEFCGWQDCKIKLLKVQKWKLQVVQRVGIKIHRNTLNKGFRHTVLWLEAFIFYVVRL